MIEGQASVAWATAAVFVDGRTGSAVLVDPRYLLTAQHVLQRRDPGTGAIGFEAASRGAERVVSVESNRETAHAIEEAAQELGISDRLTVMAAPVERALYRVEGPFDIVYLDPPYANEVPLQVFRLLLERALLAPDALVIYEHAAKRILPDIPGYRSTREEVYGDVALAFFARADG